MIPRRDHHDRVPSHQRRDFIDVHCHCLAGLDDGPGDRMETLTLCRALMEDGIRVVVATPHQLGRFEGRYDARTVRAAVDELNRSLAAAAISLTILPGADVRLDERILQLIESDEVLTVADGRRYLLLELPHEVFIDPTALIEDLAHAGITAVITHPERHSFLAQNPHYVNRWAPHLPCLQITAGCFGGGFGRLSQEAAWTLVHAPMPIVVATDAHDTRGRAPRMSQAYDLLTQQLGRKAAETFCVENPRRMVEGQDLLTLAVEGMSRRSVG